MALSKEIEIRNTGVSASYWRIHSVQLNRPANVPHEQVEVTLAGWLNEDARQSDKQPIDIMQIPMPRSEVQNASETAIYTRLKAPMLVPATAQTPNGETTHEVDINRLTGAEDC